MKTVLRLLLNLVAVLGAAWISGGATVANGWALVLFAFVLWVINSSVKPILTLLTLPITILTLGLWHLVLNGLMVWLASAFVPGFDIKGIWPAIWFALVLSVLNWGLSKACRSENVESVK